jgi:hypothetical protein
MIRAKPKKNAECEGCRTVKPLLMPIPYAPGWPYIVYGFYCFNCRLELRVDYDSRYMWLVEDMIHSKRPEARSAFDEWKDNVI